MSQAKLKGKQGRNQQEEEIKLPTQAEIFAAKERDFTRRVADANELARIAQDSSNGRSNPYVFGRTHMLIMEGILTRQSFANGIPAECFA